MSKRLPYTASEIDWVLQDLVADEERAGLSADIQRHIEQSRNCQILREVLAVELAASAQARAAGGRVDASPPAALSIVERRSQDGMAVSGTRQRGQAWSVRPAWMALTTAAALLLAAALWFPRTGAPAQVSLADAVERDLARGAYHLAEERLAENADRTLTASEQERVAVLRREQRLMALLDANQRTAVETLYRDTRMPNERETRLYQLAQAGQTSLHPVPALEPTEPLVKGPLDQPRGAPLIASLQGSTDRWAKYNLGIQYLENEFYSSARQVFDQLVTTDPQFAEAWLARGVAAFRAGELQQARRDFQQTLQLRPGDPVAQDYLARVSRGPSS